MLRLAKADTQTSSSSGPWRRVESRSVPWRIGAVMVSFLAVNSGTNAQASPSGESRLTIDHSEVEAGIFYHGVRVGVEAIVPAGYEAAVVIQSEAATVELKRKGKVWGAIWANVGDVVLDSVPSLYLLATSVPLAQLADSAVLQSMGVGYRALGVRSGVGDDDMGGGHRVFDEFVRLKEEELLYAIDEGALRRETDDSTMVRLVGEFFIPADVPPGVHRVDLVGFGEEGATLLASRTLAVHQVGLAAFVSSWAERRGLLYGVATVVTALGAGLLTGLVFGFKSKGGH